jgi:MFS family permease
MTARSSRLSYSSTLLACSIGNFVLATVINLTPVLFIPLREQFGLSFAQLGFLIFINFLTQVTCDLAFSKAADRYGFRPFAVAANALVIVGFCLFALAPRLLSQPFPGFVLATIVFSAAGGLLELLLSPIVDSVPTSGKSTTMAFLHSFYAWGQIAVVLGTTVALFLFGYAAWPWIVLFWTLPPAAGLLLFRVVPLAPVRPAGHLMRLRDLIRQPLYLLALTAILFGGAAEVTMNQWTSAFMEKALGLPKIIGDTAGMCLFAGMLGVGRLLYGLMGSRLRISRVMIAGSLLAFVCYLIVALTPVPAIGLAACALCGLGVSLLWPGTLVVSARRFPLAGAALFAILAAGGDIGASAGPWAVGLLTEAAPHWPVLADLLARSGLGTDAFGLRVGILAAAALPLASLVCQILLHRHDRLPRQT